MDKFLTRVLPYLSIVLFVLLSARLMALDARYGFLVLCVSVAFAVPSYLARRRMRRLLLSGDVNRILGSWKGSLDKVTYPETMAPLMTATAYAAYGFIEEARGALERAQRGPAWDAAVEQRLFVEALLDVYEGERGRAMTKAAELEQLPLPASGYWMRRKISLLRRGVSALARAFAHETRAEDEATLREAARSSPLVHWAMRYARAVVLVDTGRKHEARALLAGAPPWPEQSAFRTFHDELLKQVFGTA